MQHLNNTPGKEIYDCIKIFRESSYKAIELQIKSHDEAIISTIERPLAERIETFLRQLEEKNEICIYPVNILIYTKIYGTAI